MKQYGRLLLVGLAGNMLCWVGDVLLCVFPGEETVQGMALSSAWVSAPLWRFSLSAILGGVAMVAVLAGFYGVYRLILRPGAPRCAGWFLAGGLLGCIPGAAFHMQCTSAAWIYDRLGGTAEAEAVAMDFFWAHMPLMALCTAGLVMACAVLFACVARGKTMLPRWACVFNILPVAALLGCLKPLAVIPGTMNLGGAAMFLGLYGCARAAERRRADGHQALPV